MGGYLFIYFINILWFFRKYRGAFVPTGKINYSCIITGSEKKQKVKANNESFYMILWRNISIIFLIYFINFPNKYRYINSSIHGIGQVEIFHSFYTYGYFRNSPKNAYVLTTCSISLNHYL